MDALKVTRDIALRCILFGGCKIPKVGEFFSKYSFSDLVWAERLFSTVELTAFKQPLWTFYGSGSGYGSGYGYGYGSGYGYGQDIEKKVLAIQESSGD